MTRIRANGIEIEYEDTGPRDGIPLLFINGFGSQMTSWPAQFREGLEGAGMRVIRFDNRDVGLTQKWHGITPDARAVAKAMREGQTPDVPYTLNDMAGDAAALLTALGIETAHISGASMGGMIAQLVALNHPEKARSLISIFSTTSDPSLPQSSPEAQAALTTPAPATDRATVIAHTLKGRRSYASTAWPFDEAFWGELVGRNYDRMFYPEGTSRQYAAIMASPPRTERLKTLKLPTLVMHGSADMLLRVECGRHTAACIPGSEYREIEGWGHDMPLGVIPIVVGTITDFVRRVEERRGAKAAAE
ncbi:MAG TPA: alpha/beta hydrolase [Rhizomicrobium sp.]